MGYSFSENLRKHRMERGLSQQQLADKLFVDRSSIAHWEIGRRMPDASILPRIAEALDLDMTSFVDHAEDGDADCPNVIIVDDEKIILKGGMPVLERVMPCSSVKGFSNPVEALEFARGHKIDLAFLDIEMGQYSGLKLCRELIKINPRMNVVFLTSHSDYAYEAWSTGACGFMLKPLTPEAVRNQFPLLRHPIKGLARL